MKTADLQRSKRLKELGWKQEDSDFYWRKHNLGDGEFGHTVADNNMKSFTYEPACSAPTAGEMIEWLLQTHDIYFQDYQIELIGRNPWGALNNKAFSTKDGNENALADACAWVLERKK